MKAPVGTSNSSTIHLKHVVIIFWMYSRTIRVVFFRCIWQHLIPPKLPSFGFFNLGQIPNLGDFWEVYRHTGAGARGPGLVATITFVSCHQVGLVTIFSSPKSWFCYFLPQISGSTDSLCWFFFSNAVGDSTWGLMCPWQVGESFKLAKGCEDLLQIWRWITFGFT